MTTLVQCITTSVTRNQHGCFKLPTVCSKRVDNLREIMRTQFVHDLVSDLLEEGATTFECVF